MRTAHRSFFLEYLGKTFVSLVLLLVAGMATGQPREIITYLHPDITGSPVMATDAAGNVVWKERYAPYGERQVKADDGRNSLWFTGKDQDPTTGLSYFGARWYDPLLGRFTGVDPVSFVESNPQSFNRYAYGNNNPYKFKDPDGKWAQLIAPVLAGIAVLAIATGYRPQTLPGYGSGQRNSRDSVLLNESGSRQRDEATSGSNNGEGCIYCVKGENTRSGKDYVGSTDDMRQRERDRSDGRDRQGAEVVDTYPKGDRDTRRAKEQQAINDRGGVENLDNRRNEVAPTNWPNFGIQPPRSQQ